jgi:small subunit ribosomal protein S1
MSWTKKISHPGEMLKKNDSIKCIVLAVDQEKQRVALGLKQMTEDPWVRAIPEKYIAGQIVRGKVTKLTNFGVFVELEPDLEGLLHISELSDQKVEEPQDIVKVGQDIEVKILRVDIDDRKIGLSLKRAQWATEDEEDTEKADTEHQRGGLDSHPHLGTDRIDMSFFRSKAKPSKPQNVESTSETPENKEDTPGSGDGTANVQ